MQESSLGLEIWDTNSPNLYVGIEHDDFGGALESIFPTTGMANNTPLDVAASSNALTKGRFGSQYDASTGIISTSYDADGPSNGYQWTPLTSFGIAPGSCRRCHHQIGV